MISTTRRDGSCALLDVTIIAMRSQTEQYRRADCDGRDAGRSSAHDPFILSINEEAGLPVDSVDAQRLILVAKGARTCKMRRIPARQCA
jgi:hypothetical protein